MTNDSGRGFSNEKPCWGWTVLSGICVAAAVVSAVGAAESLEPGKAGSTSLAKTEETLEQRWGVQVAGVSLSAGGNMVDFRYKVLDADKAASLSKPENKPSLIDQTTGAKLIVPSSGKVGPMRQTTRHPVAGKTYFMLFANTRRHVKSGDKVTVTVGDFRVENLVVQ